jgi:alpha-amylase
VDRDGHRGRQRHPVLQVRPGRQLVRRGEERKLRRHQQPEHERERGTVTDAVANWGGPAACGDSTAVINVTVPAATPAGDTVYLAGNYDVLGTGIPSGDDWIASDYPMTQTGTDTWTLTITGVPVAAFQYKLTLGTWATVEETSSCGTLANRTFGFSTANTTYTATDTVAAWAGTAGC